jgi:opacity protein-like surface antigen
MKKLVLVAVFLFGFAVVSVAQDVPVVEVYGGYSYFRCDTQGDDIGCNLNGWDGSISFNANKHAGVVADFGGYYGKAGDYGVNVHSVMFGPKVTFRSPKVTPFVQALFGLGHIQAKDGPVVVEKENDFAIALGGGVDVNINSRIAVRPAQLEYFTVKSGGDFLKNFRYSGGIVFKLGSR